MAVNIYTDNTILAFHNVRVGGPKEKRVRRVELMGEHQPLPIYYIKVAQDQGEEYLPVEVLLQEFSLYGQVGDVYRPQGEKTKTIKEFAFVGFYDQAAVNKAVDAFKKVNYIGDATVTVSKVDSWLLDLYPLRSPGYNLHEGTTYSKALSR